jgi:hypothetical protein
MGVVVTGVASLGSARYLGWDASEAATEGIGRSCARVTLFAARRGVGSAQGESRPDLVIEGDGELIEALSPMAQGAARARVPARGERVEGAAVRVRMTGGASRRGGAEVRRSARLARTVTVRTGQRAVRSLELEGQPLVFEQAEVRGAEGRSVVAVGAGAVRERTRVELPAVRVLVAE